MDEYTETDVSQRAKKFLDALIVNGVIKEDSIYGSQIRRNQIVFNPVSRRRYNLFPEETKERMIETILRTGDSRELIFAKFFIEINANEKEAEELIKLFYRNIFGPESIFSFEDTEGLTESILKNEREAAPKYYKSMCGNFDISPDQNFPDW